MSSYRSYDELVEEQADIAAIASSAARIEVGFALYASLTTVYRPARISILHADPTAPAIPSIASSGSTPISVDAASADVAPLLATIPHDAIRHAQAGLLAYLAEEVAVAIFLY